MIQEFVLVVWRYAIPGLVQFPIKRTDFFRISLLEFKISDPPDLRNSVSKEGWGLTYTWETITTEAIITNTPKTAVYVDTRSIAITTSIVFQTFVDICINESL